MSIRRTRVVATHEDPAAQLKTTVETPVLDVADDPIVLLGRDGKASVTISIDAKISEHMYWGTNTFDRVPYTVGTFCSITLPCEATTDKINEAKQLAQQHAFEGAHAALNYALPKHVAHIAQLYPGYPWNQHAQEKYEAGKV